MKSRKGRAMPSGSAEGGRHPITLAEGVDGSVRIEEGNNPKRLREKASGKINKGHFNSPTLLIGIFFWSFTSKNCTSSVTCRKAKKGRKIEKKKGEKSKKRKEIQQARGK